MDGAMAANMQGRKMGRANASAAQSGVPVSGASIAVAPGASGCQLPLSFLRNGEVAAIVKVRGKNDLHHHLETLGFVEGARVKVVSEAAGDLIVEIKGTQVALNRQVASRIITTASA